MTVGHTHMKLDQRFSVLATGLNQQAIIETPQDDGVLNVV
jgi:hypothetical protein